MWAGLKAGYHYLAYSAGRPLATPQVTLLANFLKVPPIFDCSGSPIPEPGLFSARSRPTQCDWLTAVGEQSQSQFAVASRGLPKIGHNYILIAPPDGLDCLRGAAPSCTRRWRTPSKAGETCVNHLGRSVATVPIYNSVLVRRQALARFDAQASRPAGQTVTSMHALASR